MVKKRFLENAEARGSESLAEICRKRLKNIPEEKFINRSNSENVKNKGSQILLIILALLAIIGYVINLVLFCNWYSERRASLLITVERKVNSRMHLTISDEKIHIINNIVYNGVKKGQSIYRIYVSNPICCEKNSNNLL